MVVYCAMHLGHRTSETKSTFPVMNFATSAFHSKSPSLVIMQPNGGPLVNQFDNPA